MYGFSKLEGKPSQGTMRVLDNLICTTVTLIILLSLSYCYIGVPVIAFLEVDGDAVSVSISMLNLINNEGVRLLSINNLTMVERGSYVGVFLPPPETFQLQLVGTDGHGYNFSHITDTSVEVAVIRLSLSKAYCYTICCMNLSLKSVYVCVVIPAALYLHPVHLILHHKHTYNNGSSLVQWLWFSASTVLGSQPKGCKFLARLQETKCQYTHGIYRSTACVAPRCSYMS